ncbi:MAG: restriction endonuclease subunit S [Bacteroidetes bacterium]|nr:restriction endonuclease subunit S [Paludibacter sp.]MCL1969436.1 restriction endonuclease subunit S [Bacteroidota bacterium]MCL1969547.1 restriction endonuclease subunit S [Bacteroidota bacterium]
MKIKKGYKQTEIGIIPEDWEVKSIREIGDVCMCKRIFKYQTSFTGEIPFYKIGTFGTEPDAFIPIELYNDFIQRFSFPKKGDILFSAAGTIGRTVIYDGKPAYFQDSNIVWIDNNEKIVKNSYLHYFYKIVKWTTSDGGTVSRLYNEHIKQTLLLIPPPSEQTAIATVLSDIDEYILSLERLIAKKKAIKQGTMQNLLTGKIRLKGFKGEWVEKRIDEIVERFATGLNPRSNFMLNSGGTNYYVTIKNFFDGVLKLDESCDKVDNIALRLINNRSDLKKNDILFSSIGRVGDAYLITETPKNWNINESVFTLRPNTILVNPLFLYYFLKSAAIKNSLTNNTTGSTLSSIKMNHLKVLTGYLPSEIAEQTAIATILSDMDTEIEALQAKLSKTKLIKQGAMQQLLTGKIRLHTDNQTQSVEKKKTSTQANIHFRRSVWAAEIADRLCNEPTFGHVKMEKILFLTENMCEVDIGSHYHRDAAGPYDNRAIRSIDSQLKKQSWFEVVRKDMGYRYIPLSKRGGHKDRFNKYYSDVLPVFDKVINTMRGWDTERCEIVATLYSAWKDLANSKQQYTDDDIINEVINNWNESKKRISEERWQKALEWMRQKGFTPIKT